MRRLVTYFVKIGATIYSIIIHVEYLPATCYCMLYGYTMMENITT